MTRSHESNSHYEAEGFQAVTGDVGNPESLVRAMDGVDATVNLVAIIKEKGDVTFEKVNYQGSVNVANAARQAGIDRLIQMSALGAGNLPEFPYHFTKWRAENHIKDLDLTWTIFRPSIIFGPGDKEQFVTQLADVVRQAPVTPVIGDGNNMFQPIHLNDVAASFIRALDDPATTGGQTYELGGPEQLSYEEMLDEIGKALGKQKRKVHIPPSLMNIAVSIMNPLPLIEPPVTKDQLKMLKLDNTTDANATPNLIGHDPTPFRGNIDYIQK